MRALPYRGRSGSAQVGTIQEGLDTVGEGLLRVRAARGQCQRGGHDDIAEPPLDVLPPVAVALERVGTEGASDGLRRLSVLLPDLGNSSWPPSRPTPDPERRPTAFERRAQSAHRRGCGKRRDLESSPAAFLSLPYRWLAWTRSRGAPAQRKPTGLRAGQADSKVACPAGAHRRRRGLPGRDQGLQVVGVAHSNVLGDGWAGWLYIPASRLQGPDRLHDPVAGLRDAAGPADSTAVGP